MYPKSPFLLLRLPVLLVTSMGIAACQNDSAGTAAPLSAHAPPVAGSTVVPNTIAAPAGSPGVPSDAPPGVFVEVRPRAATDPVTSPPVAVPRSSEPAAMQRLDIPDPAGLGAPMAAMSIEVPQGWQSRGQVTWDRSVECVSNNWSVQWNATSPDGRQSFAILPRLTWQVSSATIVEMYPCPAAPMDSARSYLDNVVRNARPGARMLSYRDRPDMVAERRAGQRQEAPNSRAWHEAGEMLIGYPLQGVEMRETLIAVIAFSEIRDPMVGRSVSASAEDGLALRAPDGELDFALAERIRRSLRIERDWGERMLAWSQQRVQEISARQSAQISSWHQRRMNEITTAGILERGRIRMDTIQAVGRINNQVVSSRDATNTRIHDATIDAIQEVQPWRDPSSGQQVDLSIHYRHAWQLDDGRQFLTNDPSFDPHATLGINGHRLEPVR